MSEGPTIVGSIVGKLRMDRTQWASDVALVKQQVRELEGADPNIHIDDNAGEVVTRMEAVKVATDRVAASEDNLGQRTKAATAEQVKANEANRTSAGRVGMIATAVALLLPLLPPVAAGAAGIAGAFAGMGAAGVLAILGIVREMKDGTAVGAAYKSGIDSLGGSLNVLSHTAAATMLAYFQQAVRDTNAALPSLNTQVEQFTGLLGRSGVSLLQGTINVLRVLNPLFLTAGVYLQSLADGFLRWTQGPGLEKFGAYAMSMLPSVTDLLSKLGAAILHILDALAPIGTIGMAVLGGLADVIAAIPVDVLSQLIVTITWGAVAFKAWGFIAPMLSTVAAALGAVGVATEIATGPIGWVVAGVSALAGALALSVVQSRSATQATQQYTSALQQDNGVIGENVRQQTAKNLADAGALGLAKKLGIATKDLVDAVDGDTAAQRTLVSGLNDTISAHTKLTGAGKFTRESMDDTGRSAKALLDIIQGQAGGLSDAEQKQRDIATALGDTTAAQGLEAGASANTAQAYEQQAKAAADLQQSINNMLSQLNASNNSQQQAIQANATWQQGLAGLKDQIKQNGTTLDENTAKGSANAAMLAGLAGDAQTAADAQFQVDQKTMSAKDASDKYAVTLADQKQKFIDSATAAGFNKDQVKALADQVFKMPDSKTLEVVAETAAAEQMLEWVARDRSARIIPHVDTSAMAHGVGNVAFANGGTARGYAGGGTIAGLANGGGTVFGMGTASSDTAGLYRLANGEEVVSNKFGQADRWRAQLKAMNAGYTPSTPSQPPAATAGNIQAQGTGDTHVTQHFTNYMQPGTSTSQFAQELGRRARWGT